MPVCRRKPCGKCRRTRPHTFHAGEPEPDICDECRSASEPPGEEISEEVDPDGVRVVAIVPRALVGAATDLLEALEECYRGGGEAPFVMALGSDSVRAFRVLLNVAEVHGGGRFERYMRHEAVQEFLSATGGPLKPGDSVTESGKTGTDDERCASRTCGHKRIMHADAGHGVCFEEFCTCEGFVVEVTLTNARVQEPDGEGFMGSGFGEGR